MKFFSFKSKIKKLISCFSIKELMETTLFNIENILVDINKDSTKR